MKMKKLPPCGVYPGVYGHRPLLLDRGADVNIRDALEETALDKILRWPIEQPSREEILDLFRQYAPEQVMRRTARQG
jgi:hypothetical protein